MEEERKCEDCFFFGEGGFFGLGYCFAETEIILEKNIAPICPEFYSRVKGESLDD